MFLPGVFLSGLLRLREEEDEGCGVLQVQCLAPLLSGLRHRLGGVCAHPEDHENEAEGLED